MKPKVFCRKTWRCIALLLLCMCSLTITTAQQHVITPEQFLKLPLQNKIDTATLYRRLCCVYQSKTHKIPGLLPLVKCIVKTNTQILLTNDVSQANKVKICCDLACYYTSSDLYNSDSLLAYVNKGLQYIGNDTVTFWRPGYILLQLKVYINQNKIKSYPEAMAYSIRALQFAKLGNDSVLLSNAYANVAQAMACNTTDTLLPVVEYSIKAAEIGKAKGDLYCYHIALIGGVDFLINIYEKYQSNSHLQKAMRLFSELNATNVKYNFKPYSEYYIVGGLLRLSQKDTAGLLRYADSANNAESADVATVDRKTAEWFNLVARYYSKNYLGFITMLHNDYFINDSALPQFRKIELLKLAGESFAAIKQYDSAYVYETSYIDLKNAVNDNEYTKQLDIISRKYDIAKNQHEIDTMAEKERLNTIKLLVLFIMLLAATAVIFIVTRDRRKKLQKQITQLNFNMQYHIAELEEKAQNAGAEERKRLGQELHDDLAANLAAIKCKMEMAWMDADDEMVKLQLHSIIVQIDKAYYKTREKAHKWYIQQPEADQQLLSNKIYRILQETLPTNIRQNDIIIDDISLAEISVTKKIEILYIIKEALTNIIKHSKAKKVDILIYGENNDVVVKIKDDGKGFKQQYPLANKGMGLNSILKRVENMNGKFQLNSPLGKGTEIAINIPL